MSGHTGSASAGDVLATRLENIEADLFTINARLTGLGAATDRHQDLLDQFEATLIDLAFAPTTDTAATDGRDPAGRDIPAEPPTTPQPAPRPTPDLETLHAWVQHHVAPLVRRTTTTGEGGGVRWCRRWWEHHDAVERLTALYLVHSDLMLL